MKIHPENLKKKKKKINKRYKLNFLKITKKEFNKIREKIVKKLKKIQKIKFLKKCKSENPSW